MALGDTYRETLDRHAALLRQAEPFRARPKAFTDLLAGRAGIGREDLETFEALQDRARQHRRAATMRQVHRTRREAEGESLASETRQGEFALEGGRGEAPSLDRVETPAESAHMPPPPEPEPPKPDWWPAYESAVREWNALNERARQSGTLPFDRRDAAEPARRTPPVELARQPAARSGRIGRDLRLARFLTGNAPPPNSAPNTPRPSADAYYRSP